MAFAVLKSSRTTVLQYYNTIIQYLKKLTRKWIFYPDPKMVAFYSDALPFHSIHSLPPSHPHIDAICINRIIAKLLDSSIKLEKSLEKLKVFE